MRFGKAFSRSVGAATFPTLGTDSAPTDAPQNTSNNPEFDCVISNINGFPIQNIVVGYQYVGSGSPNSMSVALYVYDDITQAWYLSATQTVDPGKLSYFTVPALTNRAENSAGSISAFLLVTPPGGDATGTYTFTMGGDLGAGTVNVTATVSTAGLATSALQTSANTKLDTLHADLGTTLHTDLATTLAGKLDTLHTDILALKDPNTLTAITPSDSTDVTATCTKGLFVAVTGNVNVTGVGGTAQSLGTQVAGTRIRIALSKVNAATTATVFGLSGP